MKQQYAGSDFIMGSAGVTRAIETLFRPSDVAVGPDGAIYVSDWIDARVGGHQDLDDTLSGAIYRIAPKGFVSSVPKFDAATIDGQITALRSPAVNVRAIGFEGLKARGAAAINAVAALLKDPSPYIRGRAIFLLYQLGPQGRQRAGSPESQTDPVMRIAAYRAMRRANLDVLPVAAKLARDTDPGVRREVALSLRDQPADKTLGILVDIARGYDGKDRSYLEALGTGATGKEPALYERLRRDLGVKDDPLTWSDSFARHRVAPARASGRAGPPRPRTIAQVVDGRPQAGARYARLHQGSGRVQGHARARGAEQPPRRAGHVVAVEPDVERLGRLRAAAGPQDRRHLRPRRDRAQGNRHAQTGGRSSRARRSTRSAV